jgi:O-succinylbenzoate synthase
VGPPARPERLELWDVTVPMRRGLRAATGEMAGERRSIVVAVTAGGVTGWGEAAPVPGHSLDTADEAWALLAALAELVIAGEDPAPIEGSTATSALDAALIDLAARLDGSPPAVHLGGTMEPVPGSVAIDLPFSEGALLDDLDAAASAGYRHVKVKIDPASVGHVAAARHRHPGLGIAVDANGTFDAATADRLVELDAIGLDYVEQPFPADDTATTAELRSTLAAPVCLDESVRSMADIPRAVGLADAVALKPGRLGPTLTRRAIDVAARHGLGVKIGGMVETGIGRGVLVALATHPAVTLPNDLAASDRYFDDDLVVPPWALVGGDLIPRATLAVDLPNLRRLTTEHLVIA